MLTATTIMQLAEQGRLELDEPAARYVPWLSEHRDRRVPLVTIRQLLWHGAGLVRDGLDAKHWTLKAPFPNQAGLKNIVLAVDLAIDSGQKLKYSNLGYAILGQVIEAASELSCADYMQQNIFDRLGLRTGVPNYRPHIKPRIVTGYSRPYDHERQAMAIGVPTSTFDAVAGCYFTAGELCEFLAAHLPGDRRLLSEKSKRQMRSTKNHRGPLSTAGCTSYGLGFIESRFGGQRAFGHNGGFLGHRCCAYFDPERRLVVTVLTNATDAPVQEMVEGIFGVFDYFGHWNQLPPPPERARLNGRLVSMSTTLELVATRDRIAVIYPDDWLPFDMIIEELQPVAPNIYKIMRAHDLASDAEPVAFNFDKRGRIRRVNYAGSLMVHERLYSREPANKKALL